MRLVVSITILFCAATVEASDPCASIETALAAARRMELPQPPVSFYEGRLRHCRQRERDRVVDAERAREDADKQGSVQGQPPG